MSLRTYGCMVVALVTTAACNIDNSQPALEIDNSWTLAASPSGVPRVHVGAEFTVSLYDRHTGFMTEGFRCGSGSITSSDPSILWIEAGWREGPSMPASSELPHRVGVRAMREGTATLYGLCNGETVDRAVEVTSEAIVSRLP